MQARVQKWGNSLAIRIPKPFALQIGLERDSMVEVFIRDGKLMLEPVVKPKFTLEQLLAQVTKDNLHGEVDTGIATGEEVW